MPACHARVAFRLATPVGIECVAVALGLLPASGRARRWSRTTTTAMVEITGE
jgi:hypothetical protein